MLNNKEVHTFPFDLGRAFPTLTTYLTTTEKLALASSCRLLNKILYRSNTWHQFNIHDFDVTTQWASYLSWVQKYIQIIQPSSISVSIFTEEHEEDKNLLKIFLKPRMYVREVQIRCNSGLLHLAISHSCPKISSITFHSPSVSDELVEAIVDHCQQIRSIDINADSLDFTGSNIASYLKNPLERLILKPYQLDYEAIIRLLLHEELNQIYEFQIDVEECCETLLPKITSHLPFIRKLRMFHMEKFDNEATLAKTLTSQITEITLTKCYHLKLDLIIEKIASPNLQRLDFTEAILLKDQQILNLAAAAVNLKWLNISWCNELTNDSVRQLINKCLKLEGLTLNGIKALNDNVFEEYNLLKKDFNEKKYDEIRFMFKKLSKQNKNAEQIFQTLEKKTLEVLSPIQGRPLTLRNIRHLQCNSCNSISDTILKVIYCANRMSKVINYYGEVLSMYYTSELSDDQYY